jgi:hypothetical protein
VPLNTNSRDTKRRKKMGRQEVLKEILETERVYCNHLKKLEEVYDKPLLNSGLIDPQLHTKIFKDLNVIRSLNENLLKELQRNYEQDRANKKPDETIGEIFHKFAPFLKTYTSYTNNFNSIDESLRVIRQKNRELDEFLKSQSRIAGQTLESYLIMPVQRIPVSIKISCVGHLFWLIFASFRDIISC